jgi:hypothetical protein
MKNLLKNTKGNNANTLLYAVVRFIINAIFRILFIVSWILLILTFLSAIPIYIIGYILWKEDSDLFADTIYDKWFEPIQDFLSNGI